VIDALLLHELPGSDLNESQPVLQLLQAQRAGLHVDVFPYLRCQHINLWVNLAFRSVIMQNCGMKIQLS
jgi:hypothetical protein